MISVLFKSQTVGQILFIQLHNIYYLFYDYDHFNLKFIRTNDVNLFSPLVKIEKYLSSFSIF